LTKIHNDLVKEFAVELDTVHQAAAILNKPEIKEYLMSYTGINK